MMFSEFVKRWRKDKLQVAIDLTNAEVAKLENGVLALEESMQTQLGLIETLRTLVTQLQDLLDRLGDTLGEVFRASILAQITAAQMSMESLDASILEAILERDRFKSDALGLQKFVLELEELKKKDEEDGIVSSVVIRNLDGGNTMDISFKDGNAKIESILDAGGRPAKIDGKPQWALEGDAIATLEPSEDGFSVLLKPNGSLGNAKLSVTVDADLGEGVKPIKSNELEVMAVAGEASQVTIVEA